LSRSLALGARVEVTEHEISSMVGKRGVSMGAAKATDTPRKRLLVAVKLEAPHRKGATVDTDVVSTLPYHRQRAFAGTVEPKTEGTVAHLDVDTLRVMSAVGRAEDDRASLSLPMPCHAGAL
jgi:hypothetical protein